MFQTKAERNRKYRKRGGVKVRQRKQAAIARDLNQINELIDLAYKTTNLPETTTLSHNQIDSTCPFSPPTPQSSHSPGDSPSPTNTLSPVLLPHLPRHQHFTNHPTSHQGTSTSPASPEVIDLTTEPDTYSPGVPHITSIQTITHTRYTLLRSVTFLPFTPATPQDRS
ncbi:mucin-2-like [Athalia rosae]|uniref:mucin-2-like n=1 Tax=Athalia rosae TaxID=37344 RepID=UPI0020335C55|nr:mucin-2-like [Athalia rosae]